jgi:hypothetical protein
VTGSWWDQDPDAAVPIRETVLHPETFALQTWISPELLDAPEHANYRADLRRDAGRDAVLAVEREVYRASVPAGSVVLGVEFTVPYSVTAVVPLPRRWWERLLRRPVRYVTQELGGTLDGDARVRVDIGAAFRFPEFPHEFGTAIPTGEYGATPGPVRVTHVDTTPQRGPHAAVTRVLHRCPELVCHHYVSGHVPADEAESGGCTIGDCPCTRTFPDGAGVFP